MIVLVPIPVKVTVLGEDDKINYRYINANAIISFEASESGTHVYIVYNRVDKHCYITACMREEDFINMLKEVGVIIASKCINTELEQTIKENW